MQLSIIIVNYNVKYFLEQCLYSVERAIKNIAAEIIVIDNNSTDGSNVFLCNKFANVQFIWNKENVGFSKANNIGLRQAKGKHVLFLNPDTIIAEDCLEKCLAFFELQKNIGALGIRMIDGAGNFLKESKRGFLSPLTSFFKLCGLASMFPKSPIFARYYLGHLSENANHFVDVLSGAFMIVKKDIADGLGGFDEDFFMYGEDIDLSYRIQKAGYNNCYFSQSTIIHFKGESTKKESLKYINLFYGAMDLFVKKHYGSLEAGFYSFFIHIAIALKAASAFFKKLFSSSKSDIGSGDNHLSTVIVAGKNEYEAVVCLLIKAGSVMQVIGRVGDDENVSDISLGSCEQLQGIIKRHRIHKVIFCIDELTVKQVIRFIQNAPLDVVSYSLHGSGTGSVVGSNNKNEAGDIIGVG